MAGDEGTYELTDEEERCDRLFQNIEKLFKKLEKANKPAKIHGFLKEITNKLKECKTLIKNFEQEARTDGMPTPELNERRKRLVNEVNRFIAAKKAYGQADGSRGDLFSGAEREGDGNVEGMDVQQLMTRGRREMQKTEETLTRAEKIVSDTLDVGKTAASTLHDQTEKLNNIMDELNDMEFNMKKATKVLGDITKGMLTDKCIGFMLFLVVAAVIVVIVLKIVNPNKSKISDAASAIANSTNITNIVSNLTSSVTSSVGSYVSGALGNRRLLLSKQVLIVSAGKPRFLPRASSVVKLNVYGDGRALTVVDEQLLGDSTPSESKEEASLHRRRSLFQSESRGGYVTASPRGRGRRLAKFHNGALGDDGHIGAHANTLSAVARSNGSDAHSGRNARAEAATAANHGVVSPLEVPAVTNATAASTTATDTAVVTGNKQPVDRGKEPVDGQEGPRLRSVTKEIFGVGEVGGIRRNDKPLSDSSANAGGGSRSDGSVSRSHHHRRQDRDEDENEASSVAERQTEKEKEKEKENKNENEKEKEKETEEKEKEKDGVQIESRYRKESRGASQDRDAGQRRNDRDLHDSLEFNKSTKDASVGSAKESSAEEELAEPRPEATAHLRKQPETLHEVLELLEARLRRHRQTGPSQHEEHVITTPHDAVEGLNRPDRDGDADGEREREGAGGGGREGR